MTLLNLARETYDDIELGVSVLIIYKLGREWKYIPLFNTFTDGCANRMISTERDAMIINKVLTADPHAFLVNGYYDVGFLNASEDYDTCLDEGGDDVRDVHALADFYRDTHRGSGWRVELLINGQSVAVSSPT